MKTAGKKVLLRAVEEQDDEMLRDLIHDPRIVKVTKGYFKEPVSGIRQTGWSCRRTDPAGSLRCIITDREAPKTGLGVILLSRADSEDQAAEIYIKLLRSARGQGYGRDAVETLTAYAFRELGLREIHANILEQNIASRSLFEACGFRQEGMHTGRADRDGRCRIVYLYRIRNTGMINI